MRHAHLRAVRNRKVARLLFLGLGVVPATVNLIVARSEAGSVPELDAHYLAASAVVLLVACAGVVWGRALASLPLPAAGAWLAVMLARAIGESGEGFFPVLLAGVPAALTILAAGVALPVMLLWKTPLDR